MTGNASGAVVAVLDWHGVRPYGLTAVGVDRDRLGEAEALASAALGGPAGLPASWEDADPALRRRLVRACRVIPTAGLWHVAEEDPDTTEAGARRGCLRQLAAEWPQAEPLPAADAAGLPGLTALARLSALVCRMPPEIRLDAEEDLLDIYDRYAVGTLAPEARDSPDPG
ncbi:hypothetical protein [Streptomyces sudanensis]|uniref:hypothetical protein n=1 Tax=Streptomyces sudanensis TaxID=436397 RepID=UPI0020CC4811|nr:hypothetical protein [Streptomyces sudanensis]MCP9956594.1 hypothetical protein [Streptomyces sudanensis]MCQ0002802.1 hypothetical protein [Streptomyces sudanensis]